MSGNAFTIPCSRFNKTAAAGLLLLIVGTGGGCRFGGSTSGSTSNSTAAGGPAARRSTPASTGGKVAARAAQNPPDWARVVDGWWRAVTNTTSTTPGQAVTAERPPRRVVINVAAIAARHPAWELAQALERDRSTPITLTPVVIQALQQATAPEPFTVPAVDITLQANGELLFTDPAAPTGRRADGRGRVPGLVAGLNLPERRLVADELQVLQQDVRVQQINALDEFLREVRVRQDAARTEQAALLQVGLQYDIESAQRSSLSRLIPILPPEAVQLEMTNLRLQLLENIYSTEAAREAARRRLEELEAQWAEQLRRQEAERLAELRLLLAEIPARVRREGEAQISAYKEAARQRDAAFRLSVEEAQQSRAAQDFGPSTARLGIVLPASSLPAQSITGQSNVGQSNTGQTAVLTGSALSNTNEPAGSEPAALWRLNNIIGTIPAGPTSLPGSVARTFPAGIPPDVSSATAPTSSEIRERRIVLIGALRTLAARDAWRWARMVARRSGWEWQEGAVRPVQRPVRPAQRPAQPAAKVQPVQDVTQEVLRTLKLSERR